MRNAKLPILFVVAVVCVLVAGALGLVAVVSWPKRDGAESAAHPAQATWAPTGSSIAASTPQLLPEPDAPRTSASTTARPPGASPTPSARPTTTAPTAQGVPMTVSYSVTGSGSVAVLTYWQTDHDIASEHGVALPWSRTVTLTGQIHIRLGAQLNSGDARCQIAVDGQVVAEASGAYFVNCETTLRPSVHDR